MKYGDKVEWFEQLAAEGQDVPALDARPTVDGVEWIWDAWIDLGTCRAIGMDIGPVPWTAISAWAQWNGLDGDDFEELTFCVRHLEGVYRDHVDGKRKQSERRAKAKR